MGTYPDTAVGLCTEEHFLEFLQNKHCDNFVQLCGLDDVHLFYLPALWTQNYKKVFVLFLNWVRVVPCLCVMAVEVYRSVGSNYGVLQNQKQNNVLSWEIVDITRLGSLFGGDVFPTFHSQLFCFLGCVGKQTKSDLQALKGGLKNVMHNKILINSFCTCLCRNWTGLHHPLLEKKDFKFMDVKQYV